MTPQEQKMLQVGSLWFPLAMVVSMIIFVASLSWVLANRNTEINANFASMAENINRLSKAVEILNQRVGQPGGDYITRQQWIIICLQHEIINPKWKCAYGADKSNWKTETLDTGAEITK